MIQLLRGSSTGTALLLMSGFTGKSVTVPTTTPTPGAITVTPTIADRSATQAYPEAIHLSASISGQDTSATVGSNGYDARLHDVEYLWDGYYAGSANSYSYSAPSGIYSGSARHTDGHKNSRYQYGAKASFTYRVAGTYTARCYAYEPSSGKFGFEDITFTVGDQDTAFPTTQTVYADPSGTYSDAPSGCTQTTESSLSTLISTYVYGASNPVRILLAAGESFTIDGTSFLGDGHGNSYDSLYIDRRGSGANPAVSFASTVTFIDVNGTGAASTAQDIVISNIDFTGSYSDTTTATDNSSIGNFTGPTTTGAEHFLLDGCTIRNVNSHVNVGNANGTALGDRYITFNDVDMEERAFGCLRYGATRNVFTGFRMHSTPLAAIDSSSGSGWGDRIQGRENIYHSCDYFCRQGGNQIGAFRTPQPNIRANYDQGYTTNGDEYYFCANKFEAPGWLANFQFIDAEGGQEKPCNIVISKNVIIGGWASDRLIHCGTGGLTVRSNVLYMPNCVDRLGNQLEYLIKMDGTDPGSANNLSAPIKVYNNTGVNDLDGSLNPFGFTGPVSIFNDNVGFDTVTVQNNIMYNTRTSPTETADGPIARSSDEFTITDQGYLDINGSGDLSSQYVENAAAGELDFPELLTTSPSIGGVVSGLVHDSDFFGLRVNTVLSGLSRTATSKGAFEPSLES